MQLVYGVCTDCKHSVYSIQILCIFIQVQTDGIVIAYGYMHAHACSRMLMQNTSENGILQHTQAKPAEQARPYIAVSLDDAYPKHVAAGHTQSTRIPKACPPSILEKERAPAQPKSTVAHTTT